MAIRQLDDRPYFRFVFEDFNGLSEDDMIQVTFEGRYLVIAPPSFFLTRFVTSKSWTESGVHSSSKGNFPKWVVESPWCKEVRTSGSSSVVVAKSDSLLQIQKSSFDWPDWSTPSDAEILSALKVITPYIQFIHPKIIQKLVENSQDAAAFAADISKQGIVTDVYHWPDSPCLFPGVRRFIGKSDADFKKKVVPLSHRTKKQAVYLDDNSYAKQIWSHVFQGRKFSNRGPSGFELAHLFHHKNYSDTDTNLELVGLDRLSGPVSGFFTSIAGCVFIPTSLARVTDLNLQARKLIQSYAVDLYKTVCNPLPPGVSLNISSSDWKPSDFRWSAPVGLDENWEKRVEQFLTFRRQEFCSLVGDFRRNVA